jgi:1-aminocyclopropane-1-carboxylate deaminase/D-cysteine desulfhydrase-like pyridoxal-dependent ACC family enzyme
MQLHFVDREAYRQRSNPHYVASLLRELGPAYVIPEGGSNVLALRGCAELVDELVATQVPFDALVVACGTGGTLAGLLLGLQGKKQVVGVPALKGGAFLRRDVDALTTAAVGHTYTNYHLHTEAHFGGYARYSAELMRYVEDFYARHNVLLDPVYTCKAVWGTLDLISRGFFPRGSTVVIVHTGGLQGWAGFHQRFGVLPPVPWEGELRIEGGGEPRVLP